MRGKACSTEFMRRLERMVEAHEGKQKDLVKFIAHQTCITPHQIRQLLRTIELKEKLDVNVPFGEEIQPTILVEALNAPDLVALAIQAIATPEVGDKISFMSPRFDDDQHIGWNECHGIVEMVDRRNKALLIQQDETPLWAWVHERLLTN